MDGNKASTGHYHGNLACETDHQEIIGEVPSRIAGEPKLFRSEGLLRDRYS